jgi:hypothetical protein
MPSGIDYHVRATLEATGGTRQASKMQKWAGRVAGAGMMMQNAGSRMMGQTAQIASMMAAAAASAGVMAGAYGIGRAVVGGIAFNNQLEQAQYSMAATLQLMNHSANVTDNASSQFSRNLLVADAAMEDLFKKAAASPASFAQAQDMFKNMLPGARAVTSNMEDILTLTQKSLSLGMIMGGDFKTTGQQMSRILTGGAGAEFETWKVLQTPILAAGKAAGIFNDSMQVGTKLTEKFNKLNPEERWKLVEEATKGLSESTRRFGVTFSGVTSTIFSNIQVLQRELGKVAFESMRDQFTGFVSPGGILDPEGIVMGKLTEAVQFFGSVVGRLASGVVDRMAHWLVDFSDNWQLYVTRFAQVADRMLHAAKLMLKFKVAKVALGAGTAAAGGALKGGAAAMPLIMKLPGIIARLGKMALIVGPALAYVGTALVAAGGVFIGIGAYLASQWQNIADSFARGLIHMEPLFNALDHLWAKLAAVGEAFFMGANGTDLMNGALRFLTGGIEILTGVISMGLRPLGLLVYAFNMVQIGVKSVYQAFLWMISGMLEMMRAAVAAIPGTESVVQSLQGTINTVNQHSKSVWAGMKKDGQEAAGALEWGQKFDEAFAKSGDGITGGLRKSLAEWAAPDKKKIDAGLLAGGGVASSGKGHPKSTTTIHKMVVHQDLRNEDPDRIIGAFYRAVDRSIEKRVQSTALVDQGV